MTAPEPTATEPDEESLILHALLSERELDQGRASVSQVAIAKQCARLLSDPAGSVHAAQSIASLLALLPAVEVKQRQPTRAAGDCWNMQRLTEWQVELLSALSDVACGKEDMFTTTRVEEALELCAALDDADDRDAVEALPEHDRNALRIRISNALCRVCKPFLSSEFVHSPYADSAEVARLKAEIAELRAQLSGRSPKALPGPSPKEQAAAAAARAEAEAPVMRSGSGVDALSNMIAGRGSDSCFVGY